MVSHLWALWEHEGTSCLGNLASQQGGRPGQVALKPPGQPLCGCQHLFASPTVWVICRSQKVFVSFNCICFCQTTPNIEVTLEWSPPKGELPCIWKLHFNPHHSEKFNNTPWSCLASRTHSYSATHPKALIKGTITEFLVSVKPCLEPWMWKLSVKVPVTLYEMGAFTCFHFIHRKPRHRGVKPMAWGSTASEWQR